MVKTVATPLLALGFLLAPGCGRKGPLELPQGRQPMTVEGLAAEAGESGAVVVHWKNPERSVSGRPVETIETVEVWVFEGDLPPAGRPPAPDAVEKSARLVRRLARAELPGLAASAGAPPGTLALSYTLAEGTTLPAKRAFTVRVFDRKGRASDFAPPALVEIARRLASGRPPAPGRCMLGSGGSL